MTGDSTQRDNEFSQNIPTTSSSTSQETSLRMIRKRSVGATKKRPPPILAAVENNISKLQKIVSDCASEDEDEFDLFCKSIAVQLKKMPLDRALITQERLQTVMKEERLYLLNHQPRERSVSVELTSPRSNITNTTTNSDVEFISEDSNWNNQGDTPDNELDNYGEDVLVFQKTGDIVSEALSHM